eukprot:m.459895 g.459895  ORF g.459895 m.459895 type:complete len:295 (+) comp21852_c0_seq1:2-886(+)
MVRALCMQQMRARATAPAGRLARCAHPASTTGAISQARLIRPLSRSANPFWQPLGTSAANTVHVRAIPLGGAATLVQSRGKAKGGRGGRGGKGGAGGGSGSLPQLLEMVADLPFDIQSTADSMKEAADQLTKNLGTIRAAELSPSMLDHLTVKMDGTPVPLVAVAQVARENAKTTLITVFDKKLAVEVENAVRKSDLNGFECSRNGDQIRITVPALTDEYRQSLVKLAKEHLERSKVRVRRNRADGIKAAKAADGLTKDDVSRLEKCVGSLADSVTKDLDGIFDAKRKELETNK